MMTQFQKEIGVVIVLLTFFCGFFCFVEIARTEKAGKIGQKITKKAVQNENKTGSCQSSCILF